MRHEPLNGRVNEPLAESSRWNSPGKTPSWESSLDFSASSETANSDPDSNKFYEPRSRHNSTKTNFSHSILRILIRKSLQRPTRDPDPCDELEESQNIPNSHSTTIGSAVPIGSFRRAALGWNALGTMRTSLLGVRG